MFIGHYYDVVAVLRQLRRTLLRTGQRREIPAVGEIECASAPQPAGVDRSRRSPMSGRRSFAGGAAAAAGPGFESRVQALLAAHLVAQVPLAASWRLNAAPLRTSAVRPARRWTTLVQSQSAAARCSSRRRLACSWAILPLRLSPRLLTRPSASSSKVRRRARTAPGGPSLDVQVGPVRRRDGHRLSISGGVFRPAAIDHRLCGNPAESCSHVARGD